MKKNLFTAAGLLMFFLLCLVPSGYAQVTPISQAPGTPWQLGLSWTFTASSQPTGGFTVKGITYWRVLFVPSGTVSACSISFDSSASGASFSTGGILPSATIGSCAAAGQYITNSNTTPTNLGQITPTITGSGSVTVVLFGYTDNPAASGGSSSIISSPVDGSGNVKVNCETGCSAGTPGQATMSASQPVVIASNQSAIPATESGTWNVGQSGSWTMNAQMQVYNGSSWVNATGWPADSSSFTAGTTLVVPIGGWYASSISNCTTGELCTPQLTVDRKLFTVSQPSGFTALVAPFQQAVTASAVALASNSTHAFCVQALSTNSLTIYIGGSGVTTGTGYPLLPGQYICPQLSNTNLLYVIASGTGSSVAVFAL